MLAAQKTEKVKELFNFCFACLTALQAHQTAITPERLQALGQEHIIVAQEPTDQVLDIQYAPVFIFCKCCIVTLPMCAYIRRKAHIFSR